MLSGSGVTIDPNSTYLVTVGAGGAGATSTQGTSGANSSFSMVTTSSVGGGGGGTFSGAGNTGLNGGSGGGGGNAGAAGTGTSGQGFAGSNGGGLAGVAGAGGGASAVGGTPTANTGATGGAGSASSISGTSVTYAGGGGGYGGTTIGAGGSGGGGSGGNSTGISATSGTANLGGGGGGGAFPSGTGGAGGSGVVIISYAGATQQMAGGTVTIVGGNVIHTFTSSGYLTPITLLNRSLRFRSSASAYLNRTPATAGNRQTWTWSGWVKRGTLGAQQYLFQSVINNSGVDTNKLSFFYNSDNTLNVFSQITVFRKTNAVFRDPAAWYHIVLVADTNNATANNRFRLYINNVEQTYSTINNPSSGLNTAVNAVTPHYIASEDGGFTFYDGYMTEVNFIDGQALTPSSFGSINAYGSWSPVRYGGSYGTNGFYLPFTNNTSTTTLGLDFSPNGNNWTTNNISLTAGTTYDSMTDVPTLTSATAANYCVISPVSCRTAPTSLLDGNLSHSGTSDKFYTGSIAVTSGKFYYEYVATSTSGAPGIGVCDVTNYNMSSQPGDDANSWGIWLQTGEVKNNSVTAYTLGGFSVGDKLILAFDMDAGKVWFGKNGTWGNSGNPAAGTNPAFSNLAGKLISPVLKQYAAGSFNFGQQPFVYTPPSGFVALNTFNL